MESEIVVIGENAKLRIRNPTAECCHAIKTIWPERNDVRVGVRVVDCYYHRGLVRNVAGFSNEIRKIASGYLAIPISLNTFKVLYDWISYEGGALKAHQKYNLRRATCAELSSVVTFDFCSQADPLFTLGEYKDLVALEASDKLSLWLPDKRKVVGDKVKIGHLVSLTRYSKDVYFGSDLSPKKPDYASMNFYKDKIRVAFDHKNRIRVYFQSSYLCKYKGFGKTNDKDVARAIEVTEGDPADCRFTKYGPFIRLNPDSYKIKGKPKRSQRGKAEIAKRVQELGRIIQLLYERDITLAEGKHCGVAYLYYDNYNDLELLEL